MFPQFIAAKFCSDNKIPFVLTTHGMYEPWLWEKGTLKKKIYFNFPCNDVFPPIAAILQKAEVTFHLLAK